jgi:hypothetical protein
VAPQLLSEAANPQGYDPATLAQMRTENLQAGGGAAGGAVGQGGLLAARTRNAGGAAQAVSDAARSAAQRVSQGALGIQTGNARLKEDQRQSALSGLTGLTESEAGAGNTSLGAVAPAVNANTNAVNSSWDAVKYLVDPAMAAAGAAKW